MAFSVERFRNNFGGGARANLFAVFMQPPSNIGLQANHANQLTWLCQTASLPGSTVGVIEQPYMGRTLKIPGNRTFEDFTTTVLNDEDFALRSLLEKWDDKINGRASNVQASGGIDLTSPSMSVVQYSRSGTPLREYSFIGAWPSTISAIELGWDTNDAVETYDVTWTYSWYETADTLSAITDDLLGITAATGITSASAQDFHE